MPPLARPYRWKASCFLGFVCVVALLFLGLTGIRYFFPLEHRETVLEWSATHSLDPAWVAAIIRFESRFEPDALSPAGAIGLMQIMPSTAQWIVEQQTSPLSVPVDLTDPTMNVGLGTWYLRYLLDRFEDRDMALMAYNAGPSNAIRWDGDLEQAFPETRQYVRRIRLAVPIYRAYFKFPWLIDLAPSLHPQR